MRVRPKEANIETFSNSSPPVASTVRKHPHSPRPESESDEEEHARNSSLDLGDMAALHIRTPSSSEKRGDQPSPKKKRSPLSPSPNPSPALPPHAKAGDLTSKPANRKIDFLSPAPRARSSSPDLPPLRDILRPRRSPEKAQSAEPEHLTISSSPEPARSHTTAHISDCKAAPQIASKKKYIMLRESLPGAWKEVDASQLVQGKSRAWRYSQVECFDLSVE